MSRCNSWLRKSLKKSLDWAKVGNWTRHLRVPIGSLGVPIGIALRLTQKCSDQDKTHPF